MTTFNPKKYFTTRPGLWVASSFSGRLEDREFPVDDITTLSSKILEKNMDDTEILKDYVKECYSTLSQIAQLIDKQPNGEDGELLNNGYANIFYVLVNGVLFVVDVHWNSDYREWNVYDWHLDELGRWRAGRRVFRNTTLELKSSELKPLDTLSLDEAIKICKANGLKIIRTKTIEEEL